MDQFELTASAPKALLCDFYIVTVGVFVGLGSWQNVTGRCCHLCVSSYFIQSLTLQYLKSDHWLMFPSQIIMCLTSEQYNPTPDSPPSPKITQVQLSEVLFPCFIVSPQFLFLLLFLSLLPPLLFLPAVCYEDYGERTRLCWMVLLWLHSYREAINCWCTGRERRLVKKKIEIFCSLNYWVQAKPHTSTGLHKGLCLGYYLSTITGIVFHIQFCLNDVACMSV